MRPVDLKYIEWMRGVDNKYCHDLQAVAMRALECLEKHDAPQADLLRKSISRIAGRRIADTDRLLVEWREEAQRIAHASTRLLLMTLVGVTLLGAGIFKIVDGISRAGW